MNTSISLDPFHLAELSEDIDKQCQRLVTRELPKIVDEKALLALKVALRDQMTSLLTEMLNDWRHLAAQVEDDSIFDENWIIPTVSDMAQNLPQLYVLPPDDPEARKAWCIEKVRWTISSWLQMWGQLFAYLPKATEEKNASVTPPVEPSLAIAIRPFHIHAVTRIWQMLRLLTLEYLDKKAQLLNALGQSDVSLNIVDELPELLKQAKEAFWHKRPDAPVLLVLAVRDVVLTRLNAREQLRAIPAHLATPSLLSIAAQAGLVFPHPVDVLMNIVASLDEQQNLGDRLELSYLYPVFRILTDTVEKLQSAGDDAEVHRRASVVISQIAKQCVPHANHSQD